MADEETTKKRRAAVPDFDDVDLGIIAITVILVVVGTTLATMGKLEMGLGVIGTGITAISTLAGRKPKKGDNDSSSVS
jgi:hypothetical protein